MLIRFPPFRLFSWAAASPLWPWPALCEIINSLSEEEEMSNKILVARVVLPLDPRAAPSLRSLLLGSETKDWSNISAEVISGAYFCQKGCVNPASWVLLAAVASFTQPLIEKYALQGTAGSGFRGVWKLQNSLDKMKLYIFSFYYFNHIVKL